MIRKDNTSEAAGDVVSHIDLQKWSRKYDSKKGIKIIESDVNF